MTDAPKIVPTETKESGTVEDNKKPEAVTPAVENKPDAKPAVKK